MSMFRRRLMKMKESDGGNLPSEYQEVEYIESYGKHYIDTGVVPASWELKSSFLTQAHNTGHGALNIIGDSSFYYRSHINIANTVIKINNSSASLPFDTEAHIYKHYYSSGLNYIDDLSYGSSNSNSTLNFYLFAHNVNGMIQNHAQSRVYYFKSYNTNDELNLYLVPCYRKSDGVIGMYDVVNGSFYVNHGYGVFLKGADV